MKNLLTLVLALTAFAFTAQTKVDLTPYGLKASITVPAEYGEVKVDSSSYGKFKEWKVKAGKNFKLSIGQMDKQAGFSPESIVAGGKKELEKKKEGRIVFVKYVVNEKTAVIAEMKKTDKDITAYSIVYMIARGNKMYNMSCTLAEVSEADAKAMLAAAKGMTWN